MENITSDTWYVIMEYLDPVRQGFASTLQVCRASNSASCRLLLSYIRLIGLRKIMLMSQACLKCLPDYVDTVACQFCGASNCKICSGGLVVFYPCGCCNDMCCTGCLDQCVHCEAWVGSGCGACCSVCGHVVCNGCNSKDGYDTCPSCTVKKN